MHRIQKSLGKFSILHWSIGLLSQCIGTNYQLPMSNINMPDDDARIRSGVVLNLIQKGSCLGFL